MSPEEWVRAHAFLRPMARLCERVERAAAEVPIPAAPIPDWEAYRAEFLEGVPLLRSADPPLDPDLAGGLVARLVARVAAEPQTEADTDADTLANDARALAEQLRAEDGASERAVGWLLGDDAWRPARPGALRFLGWIALARYLRPLTEAFGRWRSGADSENDERWLRRYCPLCGSPPAMAQLVGADPGRRRLLACGCCGSRWQFRRTQCPFCESDSQKTSVVTIEGEGGLRIDFCETCRGYLKTYDGQGGEGVLLADWTSLHIDVIAQDRGLERRAASLYELPAESPAA